MGRGLVGSLVAIVFIAGTASAQDTIGPDAPRASRAAPFTIDAGAHAMLLFGTGCTRSSIDTEMCVDAHLGAGVHVAPFWFPSPHWSVGIRGAATFAGAGARGDGLLTFWQAEAEARYHFLNEARADAWFGADAGFLVLSEHVENDELGPPATLTSTAPIMGLAAGVSFPLADVLRLGPELRGVFIPRGSVGSVLEPRGTTFRTLTGVTLAVTGTVLIDG